jgi:type I restriction enzyme S subunit
VIFDTEQHVTQAGLDNSSARLLPAGTVCLSRTASVGFVVTMGVPMATSQDFVNWVCGPRLNPRYLHYVLLAEQDSVRRFAHGTTHQTMYYPEAKALQILAPDRPGQDAIVEVLGALDDKIAANNRLAATAMQLASLKFDVTVSDMPKVPTSRALAPILGGTPSRAREDYWHGDVAWASARDVASARTGVILETAECISRKATQETKVKPLPAGSVVLTARGTVGALARLGVPAAINQSCYGFQPVQLPPATLYFAIRSVARQAKSLAHGSVFDTITMRTFEHTAIPDPSADGVATLESEIEPLLALAAGLERQSLGLASTRDALLPLLMSGRVRVKDAETTVEGVV